MVQVTAAEIDKFSSKRSSTNMFTYVFSSTTDRKNQTQTQTQGQEGRTVGAEAVQVMPREYDEFVLYLEGRRALEQTG